jgi:hypothetical protein
MRRVYKNRSFKEDCGWQRLYVDEAVAAIEFEESGDWEWVWACGLRVSLHSRNRRAVLTIHALPREVAVQFEGQYDKKRIAEFWQPLFLLQADYPSLQDKIQVQCSGGLVSALWPPDRAASRAQQFWQSLRNTCAERE